jgi:putative membrane protein
VTEAAEGAADRPFDVGLQAERTLLAWRRTCLSLAVGNVAAIKYLSDALGAWATLLGFLGLVLSVIAWVLCTVRYRRAHSGLVRDESLIVSGRLPALVTVAVGAAGIAALVVLFALWRPW